MEQEITWEEIKRSKRWHLRNFSALCTASLFFSFLSCLIKYLDVQVKVKWRESEGSVLAELPTAAVYLYLERDSLAKYLSSSEEVVHCLLVHSHFNHRHLVQYIGCFGSNKVCYEAAPGAHFRHRNPNEPRKPGLWSCSSSGLLSSTFLFWLWKMRWFWYRGERRSSKNG